MTPMTTWPRLATAFLTATAMAATLGLAGCERRTTTDTATDTTPATTPSTTTPSGTDTAPAGAMPPASAASQ